MDQTDKIILSRMKDLVVLGENVLRTRKSPGPGVLAPDFVDNQLAVRWGTSVQGLFERVFGTSSTYFRDFRALFGNLGRFHSADKAHGILVAAKEDFEHGFLFNVRSLLQADLFDDFLEQAEHLLDNGYKGPAAVVAGAVIEDGLRKLCERHDIVLSDRPKLDRMNADLARARAYNKLTQKKVTTLADIRNDAAHGNWEKFTDNDVVEMIRYIRRFMGDHFG